MADKPLVLVVEDEKDYADNLAEMLTLSGKFDAVTANSGPAALEIIKKNKKLLGDNRIRLVLLDIKMPGMSGLEVLEKIRSEYGEDKMGVIMLTAWEDEEKWQKARLGSTAGYIRKPFNEDELINAVERFFSGKHSWMVEQTKWDTLAREAKQKSERKIKEQH